MLKKSVLFVLLLTSSLLPQNSKNGNVIFLHPDGTSLADWNTVRILTAGPDGEINWDKLYGIGLYQGHIRNRITASSNAGATTHAYGVKADVDDFGMIDSKIPTALSGKQLSIMQEAKQKGVFTGLINSGSIIEPGTAVFVSSETERDNYESIAKQVILSGTDLIFSGGEDYLIPVGTEGVFCKSGKRTDGLNLIQEAVKLGYKIVYSKEELLNLSPKEKKVLGVFAEVHTFNDNTEEAQKALSLQNYSSAAPTLKEMTEFALAFFREKGQFILVIEEEGTDNFGNKNNAKGKIEALKRADDAIAPIINFIDANPHTLLITAADSEAGGMEIAGLEIDDLNIYKPLPAVDNNGSPIDGVDGSASLPFVSAPDKNGRRFPFGIAWSTYGDVTGSIIARAHGLNAERMKGKIDNTDIYRIMYLTLFGVWLN
jgi:alkaline phosphatase